MDHLTHFLYPHHLAQSLAHDRCSINVYQMKYLTFTKWSITDQMRETSMNKKTNGPTS